MNTETQFNEDPKHGKVYCASGFCGSFEEYNTAAKKHKQQTAVEWLAEKYNYITWMRNRDEMSPETADKLRQDYLEQAKQMEKEQSISILTKYHNSLFYLPFKDGEAEAIYNNINFTNDFIDPD